MNDSARVRRRPVLLAAAAAPLLGATLTGCSSDTIGKRLGDDRADADPDAGVRWRAVRTEERLLAVHIATVSRHDRLRDRIAPFAEHHRRHLEALLDDGPLPFLLRPEIDPSSADDVFELSVGTLELPDVASAAAGALAALVDAERSASEAHLASCLRAAGPDLAALLSSIAAAEATHETALERA
ncbi:hypothetical protein [Phytoactinopolyspora halotolerans]|uniref:Ferritin-like domain-containing protein n=1 Tax=Phytoactinopolyspora halotolerans TaxID=1981512 RepID=A0A6L9S4T8_9ACTN|nr:hypothetical protein [Phytoactinopolyspora halotolerans]NEE00027.1 hypothetical protein [Phytoactinopolyspora halotolerans]